MIYDILAPYYDDFNSGVGYIERSDFTEECAEKYMDKRPEIVLDLGCGTGTYAIELAKRGYDMICIDISPEMLSVAHDAAERARVDDKILWVCQDMRDFELYGTVDLAVSALDCINHLPSLEDIKKCFSLVHTYLIPGGLFIFDFNGKERFETDYKMQDYVYDRNEKDMCIWQSYYFEEDKRAEFYISLFEELDNGYYIKHEDVQYEQMYLLSEIKEALLSTGFEIIGAYSDFKYTEASDKDKRIYVVAKCKKD